MRLRVNADWRAVLWVFGLMPLCAGVQLARPALAGWLMPFSIYLAYAAGVLAHNHNHCPVFRGRRMNGVYSAFLSFFYGYPTFAWIPTHNENHHRFTNKPGDATATWQHMREGSAWAAFTFFFHSSAAQAPLIARYMRRVKARSTRAWWYLVAQYVVVFGGHAVACAVAMKLHGVVVGGLAYLSALGVPGALALWGLMFTNYVQHERCDADSRYDHSRNFVSRWMNWLVFDNGFHTVHHERPGLHWSLARREHEKIAHLIDPALNEQSILGYAWKAYVLGRPVGVAPSGRVAT